MDIKTLINTKCFLVVVDCLVARAKIFSLYSLKTYVIRIRVYYPPLNSNEPG